ncbi:MAG TPA: LysR family transcriptional regulator [Ramlibacter sp.]|nr:LysR family transcriptional regulator [Ramlibacter sp.]
MLIALEALLSSRSVTAAASRLHVSQPSMSGSLGRLREHFGDKLLVQVGRSMDLTPLGNMLLEPVREALEKVESTIALRPDFDPATGKRHFSVCASEATVLTLLIDVLKRVENEAPGITVELLPADPAVMAEKLTRRELDFTFGVEGQGAPDHPQALVIHDTFHCAVWTGNKRVRKSLTFKQYLAMGHAITRYGFDKRPGFEQFTLQRLGMHRRVEVSCTTPALLGPLVVGTQRIATLPTKLAHQQAAYLPLRLFAPPLELPPLRIIMQWHRTREHDGATAWFRDLVIRTSRDIDYEVGPA